MTDRLSLANALADAKIDRSTAERIATEIYEAIHQNVATKTDLELLRRELKADIELVRSELRGDIELLRSEVKGDIASVRQELELLEHRLMMRLGSLIVVVAGLLFAALRYLPPVH